MLRYSAAVGGVLAGAVVASMIVGIVGPGVAITAFFAVIAASFLGAGLWPRFEDEAGLQDHDILVERVVMALAGLTILGLLLYDLLT